MDWIFIGTWMVAFVTLVMATVVAYYNRKTLQQSRQHLDILRKQMERPQVVELLKFAVFPLLIELSEEAKKLNEIGYNWVHESEKSHSTLVLGEEWWEKKEVMRGLRRKFPQIRELIDNHDKIITSLNESLKALDKVIYTSEFVEKCKKAIETYNANCPKELRVRESKISDAPQRFVSYVIDNLRELPEASPYRDFWKKHSSQFLEIREKEEVKNEINNVEKITEKLGEISLSLLNKLVELWGKLREEYWITVQEIGEDRL